MNEREKFEVWAGYQPDFNPSAWQAWQACADEKDKELAALQAVVKDLKECYEKVSKEMTVGERYSNIGQAIIDTYPHTTTPDQSLQRALLDARIDELGSIWVGISAEDLSLKEDVLRTKRAELGE